MTGRNFFSANKTMLINQKSLVAVAVAVFLVLAGVWFFSGGQNNLKKTAPLDRADVVLTEKGFVPETVTVRINGSVRFSTNRDKPLWPASNSHPTHDIYSEFDPRESILAGEKWTFQFNRAGKWGYHDHLRSYYTGTIYVVQ